MAPNTPYLQEILGTRVQAFVRYESACECGAHGERERCKIVGNDLAPSPLMCGLAHALGGPLSLITKSHSN